MAIQINGTSGISGVDGSATTPALQGSDTNTGISFGTDEVNIVTNGITRATVDSSGRVGIGTATPGNYEASGDDLVVSSSGETGITIVSSTSTGGNLYFADGTTGNEQFRGWITYTHGSTDALRFGTAGSERVRILSGGGLTFNGDTATANALDDYEEGTWTPAAVGTNTLSSVFARYVKVGKLVWFTVHANLSTTASPNTGHISGLPFSASSTQGAYPIRNADNILTSFNGAAYINGTTIYVQNSAGTGSAGAKANLSNVNFGISGCYETT